VFDHTGYEEGMFYFNTVARPALYQHDVQSPELDHCYDCVAEIEILRGYLAKFHSDKHPSTTEQNTMIAALSSEISRSIATNRTLLSGNLDPEDRRIIMRKRQGATNVALQADQGE